MFTVALFGAGKIGDTICGLLSQSKRYKVKICDYQISNAEASAEKWGKTCTPYLLNLDDEQSTREILKGCDAVISALPYFCNVAVAKLAKEAKVNYFDLTEDVKTTRAVEKLAKGSKIAYMPQCGLAPGFISIVAAHLVNLFDKVENVKMRVGALPIYPSNYFKYNLTWSTEGLINEYGNMCEALENGKKVTLLPLEGFEHFSLDGVEYEAFNTSGGLGTLCTTLANKVKSLNYKSIRYPGHREYTVFLMNDLKFNEDRDTLKKVLERSIPTTTQDKCIIFVEVKGHSNGKYVQRTYASTIYNTQLKGHHLGAIQVTTASGICAPMDLLLTGKLEKKRGFLTCESIPLPLFLDNEFGKYYLDKQALKGL